MGVQNSGKPAYIILALSLMQVPGSDNAGPGNDILGPVLMSEGKETLLEKKKANGIMLDSIFILSEIFISECTK